MKKLQRVKTSHGDAVEHIQARPDSIKVAKNASGTYSWEIKVYYDSEVKATAYQGVIDRIKRIDNTLRKKFK